MSDAPIRLGLLGAARITPPAVIQPARELDGVEIVAVAARDRGRADAFAAEHRIPVVLDDYAALVACPEIDAVYNALPASLHHPWTVAALEHGKHVLCEKPFAANAAQAEDMVRVAEAHDRVLVEAFHWRYHPLAARLGELVRGGAIGTIEHAEGTFCVGHIPETDIRYVVELGGGATMDLGCYPIQWVRFVVGEEPVVTTADAIEGPPGIDLTMTADFRFPGGATGRIHCSMEPGCELQADLLVRGSLGTIEVVNPLAPHSGHSLTVRTGDDETSEQVSGRTTYHHQLEAFVAAVRDGVPAPTGGTDAIASMRVVDAVYTAAGMSPRGT